MLLAFDFGFGQSKIAEVTFESPGGYITNIPEFTDFSADYFIRTDGTNISTSFNLLNAQGSYYFGAEDLDGEGASLPVRLFINDINITNYSSLEFRVHLAENDSSDSNEDWDRPDYVHFNYDINNTGTFSNLLWLENDGSTFNTPAFIDTNFDGTGDGTEITNTFTQFTQNILGTGDLLDLEIIFNLDSGDEDLAIDNIEIWGVFSPCPTTATWNGSSWSSAPDLTTEVILNDDYDTNSLPSFQACSLTVSSGSTLTIGDGTFVEVENDLTVEASAFLYVASQGAFVQNNDAGLVTSSGTIEVTKTTAPLNNWYEYTYWSSPVANADIDNGLSDAKSDRRYSFNAQNFLDAAAETNNNNATVAGQDDIDDNGDDWFNVNGTTVMQPGVGYAAMHDPAGFAGPGGPSYEFSYTFEGDFNNGEITVPVYRNDSELKDINWNFVGNPYPSAIDADAFLAANANLATDIAGTGYLDGAIFLWSQNTAPASTTNGNEPLNFSNDDYAIINLSGETAGGDGTTAVVLASGNRAIPSGQGFFVSFSNGATPLSTSGDIAQGEITFNNAMRVTDITGNNEFFRTANSKNTSNTAVNNKLWVNLTSNNGIYNQILIAYLNGATSGDDGLSIDANKHPGEGVALYSIIEDSNKKFAIQGKPVESINEDEIINLGFNTYITAETLYTLSIAQLQGNFMNSNNVYLKDNLLNVSHNLSEGDYSFTSETGEFTDRFQIVFKEDSTLSVTDMTSNESAFQIIQRDSDRVTFKTGTSATLKSIAIYDLFGRKVYQFKGENSSETFNIPNIKTGIYLAKAELSTGVIITKKAIKR